MKKVTAALLAVLCFLLMFSAGASADGPGKTVSETLKCSTLRETSDFIFDGYPNEIAVLPVQLTENGETRTVYLASAMGMGFSLKKANNPVAAFFTAFNVKTKYFKIIKKIIIENVPENSELILIGHSMGGMVMQQIRSDKELTAKYEIIKTVTIGSPYIMTSAKKQEGTLSRFGDSYDLVPKLSPAIFFSRKNHKNVTIEDGGFTGDRDAAHNRSYRYADVWDAYDALGVRDGDAYFEYDTGSIVTCKTFYKDNVTS